MLQDTQFVIDAAGRRTAAIVPIEDYEDLLEELHIAAAARESQDEPKRPFVEVVQELRAASEIDV